MKPSPCARCGQPSECEIWGTPSCRECHTRWMTHPLTTTAELEKAAGIVWSRVTALEYETRIERAVRPLLAKWKTKEAA